ncbi:MAG TPA: hypothetical protein VE439_01710 [Anaerolineae bacterium]|nr:hypothetical protein [Anaerolineae bacterium]
MFNFFGLLGRKNKVSIDRFRAMHNWYSLDKSYYENLSFLDIEANIDGLIRKKSISKGGAESKSSYSTCYFNKIGLPIRIDKIGGAIPSETYLVWHGDILTDVFQFRLGYKHGQKVTDKIELAYRWRYKYEGGRLMGLVQVCLPDPDYWANPKHERHHRHEYDQKGLLRTYRWVTGLTPELEKMVVVYDREREELLSGCTISKSAYISKRRRPRRPAPFKRQFYTEGRQKEVPICQKCNQVMSYLGYVDLEDNRFARKHLLKRIPIFCCLECLEGGTINLISKANFKTVTDAEIFLSSREEFDFLRSYDEEANEEALIKLGGLPDWIQGEQHPECPECNKPMTFVCQFNSSEDISNSRDVQVFGDNGKLYVFTCCDSITTIMQHY